MCEKCFTAKRSLQIHERTHTKEKPYQCKSCDVCLTRKGTVRVHERNHTKEKPYQCETCDMWFTLKRDLQVHKKSHIIEKPYQCKACDKCFTQKGTLQRHEKLHSAQQPYSSDYDETFTCWICQEELSSASQLLSHYEEHMQLPWSYCLSVYLIGFWLIGAYIYVAFSWSSPLLLKTSAPRCYTSDQGTLFAVLGPLGERLLSSVESKLSKQTENKAHLR